MRSAVGSARSSRSGRPIIKQALDVLQQRLLEEGVEASLNGRPKHFYSIYEKMRRKNLSLDQLYDLLALRVVVGSVGDCYQVLGLVHTIWKTHPGAVRRLHRQPQEQHVPVPAHHCAGAQWGAPGGADPHLGDAPVGGVRHRRPLALQGGPPAGEPAGPAAHLDPAGPGVPAGRVGTLGVSGQPEDRRALLGGPGVHPQGGRGVGAPRLHPHRLRLHHPHGGGAPVAWGPW